MVWVFRSAREATARRQHVCEQCGLPINPGTRYRRSAGVLDGALASFAEHLDCRLAWKVLNFERRGGDPAVGAAWLIEDELQPAEQAWLQVTFPAVASRMEAPR